MPTLRERLKRTWNAFTGRDPTVIPGSVTVEDYSGSSYRPDRYRFRNTTSRTILGFIYNRIAVDVASVDFKHVRCDQNDQYKETIYSNLTDCLAVSANIDQTGRAFIQDAVESLLDEGVIAIVPVECETNLDRTEIIQADITQLRAGKIVEWYPNNVKVNLYNQKTGKHQDIIVPKAITAIVENPFYSIMNEPNSTLQRLVRTIRDLDSANSAINPAKLDMIIQLPYVIKSELRKQQAEQRRSEIEEQLANSKYGIAYADGTERIVQLNRSLDNSLWTQVKELTEQLYNEMGITAEVFNGTANEAAMLNYNNRTISPICTALCESMKRTFLTKTARTQKQSIEFFKDPFKLVPVSQIAEIGDKFTRNEIMSSNELRAVVGLKPVDDERANELRNKNMPVQDEMGMTPMSTDETAGMEGEEAGGGPGMDPAAFDSMMQEINNFNISGDDQNG